MQAAQEVATLGFRRVDDVELSVVIPCLNEAETVGNCIAKANQALDEHGIAGEIILADNGSDDDSVEIATELGARVVVVEQRGYGAALMGGIAAARGRFVIMADADGSYDLAEVPRFLEQLRAGCDLAQGCRLPGGGGTVLPGAMPVLHRWIGNPLFTRLVRWLFNAPINDVYCGMRGFRKDQYDKLNLRCAGMEFANEMIVKSALLGQRISEVPITLHPDGRQLSAPHLRTFRDGWRTLRLLLMCSPSWLYLLPSLLLLLGGLAGYGAAMFGVTPHPIQALVLASLSVIVGYQVCAFGVVAGCVSASTGFLPVDPKIDWFSRIFSLERGLLVGIGGMAGGAGVLLTSVPWQTASGTIELSIGMLLPFACGVTLFSLGFLTTLASFVLHTIRFTENGSDRTQATVPFAGGERSRDLAQPREYLPEAC